MKTIIINYNLFKAFQFLLSVLLFFSTQTMLSQSIIGPTNVAVGDEEGYTLSGASANSWAVPAGTQIISETNSTVVIRFNTAGPSFVRALHNVGPGFTNLNITVTGPPPPTPNNPTVLSNNCNSTILQKVGNPPTGVTWYWQGKNGFGTSTGLNANSNYTANLTTGGSGTYYIRARNSNNQWSASSASINVTITETPTAPPVNNVPPSCGGPVTLSVSNPNPAFDYRWYNASGSAWIGTGNSFTTDPLTANTNFLVRAVTKSPNPICVSPATTVVVPVNSPPTPSGNQTVTSNCNSPDIELTASNTTFPDNSTEIEHRWYFFENATGPGNYIVGTPQPGAGFRTKIVVSGITEDTTYWVAAVVNGCESGRHPITADYEPNNEPTLDVINITGPQCGPSTNFTLNATVVGGNGDFTWYDAQTGGNEVATGNQYIPTITTTGTTSFWVGGTLTNALGCDYTISPRQEVQVVLYQLPNLPTVSNDAACGNNTVTFTASGGITGATYNWYQDDDTFIESGASFTTPSLTTTTDYKVSATLNGCEGPKRTVSAFIGTVPGVAGGAAVSRCGSGTVTLTATLGTNANEIRWFDALTGGNELGTGTEFTTLAISENTYYYAESVAGTCAATTRHPIEAIILAQNTYYEDADNDSLGDPASSVQDCTRPDGYVENNSDQCPTVFSPTNDCSGPSGDPADWNYVYTRAYQTEQSTDTTPFFDPDDNLIQDITYFDGLGRPIQQNGIDQSPNSNDIITHMDYDGFGRMEKEYLPYATTDTDPQGSYRLDALTPTENHYDQIKYQNTTNPYSQKKFEDSPLNRVLKQAALGNPWALIENADDRSIEFDYSANSAAEDHVKQFSVTLAFANNTYTPTLVSRPDNNGEYVAGELTKMVTKDENHDTADSKLHTTEEFTDKQGRVVLKRTYALVGGLEEPHDTYYVYDDFGNLSYVLPPKMDGGTANLDELGYQYVYDHRNRLVEKKIPGKSWEHIVYNRLDQPIMTQDANQRLDNEWLFTKYDAFGRVAYTGKAVDSDDRETIQGTVDGLTGDLWVVKGGLDNFGGTDMYYDNGAYPIGSLTEVLTINYYDDYSFDPGIDLIVGNVYDRAVRTNVKGLATGSMVKVLETNEWITAITQYDDKSRPIYTVTKNDYLGTLDVTRMKIDFVGRPLLTRTEHTRNGATVTTIDNYTYDHVGRLLAQTQCVGDETLGDSCEGAGGGGAPVDLILTGTIDIDNVVTNSIIVQPDANIVDGGILRIDPNATGGSGGAELIVLNSYDELGRLDNKKVGGDADATDVLNSAGLQTVNYDYNVRDWLTSINDPNAMGDDLFAFDIKYNDVGDPSRRLYNGNISQTVWNSANNALAGNPASRNYVYTYDALNRITGATGLPNTNYNVSNITYDKNGNIMTLKRDGHTALDGSGLVTGYGVMDDLTYAYTGNQLNSVDDDNASSATQGFVDGSELETEYTYDENGNMETDTNKGITGITYNHLNLPEQVSISGGSISYVYDATGIKQKKTVSIGTVTDYAGNYIYENGALQFFNHEEGYVSTENDGYDYIYQYEDHLGNIRLSYSDTDNNGAIDPSSEILEENNYYPFGLKHKGYNFGQNGRNHKYGFGGKEEQEDDVNGVSLDWLDFGARNYDASLGRWMNLDPLGEISFQFSPYNYVKNDPVRFTDPTGMIWKDPKKAEKLKKNIRKRQESIAKSKAKDMERLNEDGISDRKKERINKRIANYDDRTESLNATLTNIDILGNDQANTFDLVGGSDGKNHVYKGTNGVINIQGPNDALKIHELTHAATSLQSKKGLRFRKDGKLLANFPGGLKDEMIGYRAQFGFSPSSLPSSASSMDEIDKVFLASIQDENNKPVYTALYKLYNKEVKARRERKRAEKKARKAEEKQNR